MIQALALELLWSRLHESPYLWSPGWDAVVGWAQVAAVLLGFLQIWIFYTSLVMRFRWAPSLWDSIAPFVIGIVEFGLIDLQGPESFGAWFYALALVYAISVYTGHGIFRRARLDPANASFFESVRPAGVRDFVPEVATVVGLVLLGVVLQLTGNRSWLALFALLLAIAALAYQLELGRRFWNMSMSQERGEGTAT